jgi:hypothetical protein
MMTEREAEQKWCPQARVSGCMDEIVIPAANRLMLLDDKGNGPKFPVPEMSCCIASRCMAWRWDYDQYGDATEGFCGLAGRP